MKKILLGILAATTMAGAASAYDVNHIYITSDAGYYWQADRPVFNQYDYFEKTTEWWGWGTKRSWRYDIGPAGSTVNIMGIDYPVSSDFNIRVNAPGYGWHNIQFDPNVCHVDVHFSGMLGSNADIQINKSDALPNGPCIARELQ